MGVISIEEGKDTETAVKLVKGMQFDRGYLSPYFITNAESMTVELDNPLILVHEKKISSVESLKPLLEDVLEKLIVIAHCVIAEDVEGAARNMLVMNRLQYQLKWAAIKAPGFGDRRKAMMEDIAVLAGTTMISEELGHNLKDVGIGDLGTAKKVTISKDHTSIIGGAGDQLNIDERCKQIENKFTTAHLTMTKKNFKNASLNFKVVLLSSTSEPKPKSK